MIFNWLHGLMSIFQTDPFIYSKRSILFNFFWEDWKAVDSHFNVFHIYLYHIICLQTSLTVLILKGCTSFFLQSFLRITVWHVLPLGKTAKQISYKKYL